MDNESLTNVEEILEREYKSNFVDNYANLIADNIASLYKHCGNDHQLTLQMLMTMSKDDFPLDDKDNFIIRALVRRKLNKKHNLMLSSISNDKIVKINKKPKN